MGVEWLRNGDLTYLATYFCAGKNDFATHWNEKQSSQFPTTFFFCLNIFFRLTFGNQVEERGVVMPWHICRRRDNGSSLWWLCLSWHHTLIRSLIVRLSVVKHRTRKRSKHLYSIGTTTYSVKLLSIRHWRFSSRNESTWRNYEPSPTCWCWD